ncbi:hypothetical protein GUITHDRAFT_105628 [Guillardia theta CCMP2712]|uniref:Uncharacterized protein n=1 Tax=Guillardia theta (strain CCMP2712) TaxID=905079 RepID=L1JJ07_GUITC|nr:hypothetical protein GUITHDRAFT_105628 [Guillardia theta CCMP2712]EKX48481.1 hypothetical protein GUITHDRAFT_105628 [Guillardia theta CCMP2712]|eukprot:XP_005835461.1 hypothetical protein GUITHDRAFT_105628 [Guillardia theta CCMP2712]
MARMAMTARILIIMAGFSSSSSSSSSLPDSEHFSSQSPSSPQCKVSPALDGTRLRSSPIPGTLCPCSKSASLSVALAPDEGGWSMRWQVMDVNSPAVQQLSLDIDLSSLPAPAPLVVQVQLRQGMEVLAVREYLMDEHFLSNSSRCLSFVYEDASPGMYAFMALLHRMEGDELEVVAIGDHSVRVVNASEPAMVMEHATLQEREMSISIRLRGMTGGNLLLVLVVTEVNSLEQSREMLVLHMNSSEHVQDVRVSAPGGSEYLILATVSELENRANSSIAAKLTVRKFLKVSRCNEICVLEDDFSRSQRLPAERRSAKEASFVRSDSVKLRYRPHPEEVLCNLVMSPGTDHLVAGVPFKASIKAIGLVPGCRYRVHLTFRHKEKQVILFHQAGVVVVDGSTGSVGVVHFDVPSAWSEQVVMVSVLYDYFAEHESDDTLLAYLSRKVQALQPCMVSYLWTSGNPLFQGQMPYQRSPFSMSVRATRRLREDELGLTLSTVATLDRAVVLINAAAQWNEHVAVAFYARSMSEQEQIKTLVQQTLGPWFIERNKTLEATLLTSCPDKDKPGSLLVFPINMLRKISCAIARTDLVLYADVDMLASDGLASNIRQAYQDGKVGPTELLVIPSFKTSGSWPREAGISLEEQRIRVEPASISMEALRLNFEGRQVWIPGLDMGMWSTTGRWHEAGVFHAGTEYDRWMEAEETYQVKYILGYEPYVVVNRSAWRGSHGVGLYDDRFVHWGWDKVSLGVEACNLGYTFTVLPKSFLMHGSSAIESVEHFVFDRLAIVAPPKQGANTGWGPPDTHGRELLQRLLSDYYTDVQPHVPIRSCLIRAFRDDKCDISRIHLVQSTTLELVGSEHLVHLDIFGLSRATGYQLSVQAYRHAGEGEVEEDGSFFFLLLPGTLVEDPHGMSVSVGRLSPGLHTVRVELKDLHAAKLLLDKAILAWGEHKYEVP